MFNPEAFYLPTTFTVTAAARMMLVALENGGYVAVQSTLQISHKDTLKERVPMMKTAIGGIVATRGLSGLYVLDSILPDDFQRRAVICMDTELDDQRIAMFKASGLIPSRKKG